MLFRFFSYISGMNIDSDIFKIQSNNVLPSRGRILISEPFLRDATFGRSVILLVDHTDEGSMGLVINKQLPLFLNDIIMEFKYLDEIPLYKGGPIATDTLNNEIRENTWLVSEEEKSYLMKNNIKDMWRTALEKLGSKYETWSRFPQVPTLN